MKPLSPTVSSARATTAEIARNAVLEQQRRLAAEFGATRSDQAGPPAATGPFARMLCEVLASVGWEGKQHRIFEALPHLDPDPVGANAASRSRASRRATSSRSIGARPICPGRIFPACWSSDEDNCHLVTLGARGRIRNLRLATEPEATPIDCRSGGAVYLIRLSKIERFAGQSAVRWIRRPRAQAVAQTDFAHYRLFGRDQRDRASLLSLYVLLVYDIVIATSSLDTLAFLASAR